MHAPPPTEFGASFAGYIAIAQTVTDPIGDLQLQLDEMVTLLRSLNPTQWHHRYAHGKWSLQELLGHISDTERIFAYRALRIARGDQTPLPGFEQDPYVEAAESDRCDSAILLQEFEHVRRSTIFMCRNFPEAAWTRIGTASNGPMSTRAMVYIILGHAEHHLGILRERYL
jgi:hypothetical protein